MGRYDLYEEKSYTGVVIVIILLILAASGAWFYWQNLHTQPELVQTQILTLPPLANSDQNTAADENKDATVALDEVALPEEDILLPELSSSDQAFRDAMLGVSAELAPWLKSSQLITKYVVVANDFSQGLWLEKHMRFLKPSQRFVAEKTSDGWVMSTKSYQRYNKLAKAIDAMDPQAALKVYRQYKPLLQQVFAGFGYPADRPLDDIFLKSAAQILAAPQIEEPLALVRPSVFYKYADKKLEALSPISKQMLRMGPENTRIIQNKVRLLVQELVNSKD